MGTIEQSRSLFEWWRDRVLGGRAAENVRPAPAGDETASGLTPKSPLSDEEAWRQFMAANEKNRKDADEQIAALKPPPDKFRIVKDFTNGTFEVREWRVGKTVLPGYPPMFAGLDMAFPGCPMKHLVFAGHETLKSGLPSVEVARDWLAAHLDPSSNLIPFDADGRELPLTGGSK